jgi:hypothetical protein
MSYGVKIPKISVKCHYFEKFTLVYLSGEYFRITTCNSSRIFVKILTVIEKTTVMCGGCDAASRAKVEQGYDERVQE